MRKIVVLKPTVNVRRGPSQAGGIIDTVKVGDQLEMVGELIPTANSVEKWAQVKWPKNVSVNAYVCVTLSSGGEQCTVVEIPNTPNGDYAKGWNDCLDAVHQELVRMRK